MRASTRWRRRADAEVDDILREISDIRRNCLALKRYMSPQHEALVDIAAPRRDWMSPANLEDIRETIDRLRKYHGRPRRLQGERDRAAGRSQQPRRQPHEPDDVQRFRSSTAVFLPLSFVTGLLGINVGGMPGAHSNIAFWATVALLVALFGFQLYLFRRLKWI